MLTFTPDELHAATSKIFRAAGADEENTTVVADHLIDANLCGHDSHGIIRIPSYVQAIKRNQLSPAAKPQVVRETAAMALIDAHHTFGQVSALFAADRVVAKAKEHGVAVAGTYHGTHIGRLGYYPTRAAERGAVLFVAYGSLGTSGVPYGGRKGAFGTNPISIGFPAEGDDPFLLDFATTTIAAGKVSVARDKHEQLPPNSAIDQDGKPTTDPNAVPKGGLLTFGGHKGYALSLMSLLLSNVLVRPDAEPAAPADSGSSNASPEGARVFFLAIDSNVFGEGAPPAAAEVFEKVRATPPAEGVERVLIPGEPERLSSAKRRAEGVPVAEDTWASVKKTASELGVSL
jgi:LDH2 family malate/lactate/ureidoglycolate dehydrogenase